MKLLLLLFVSLCSGAAWADTRGLSIDQVRAQLPAGFDLAKYQANQMRDLMTESMLAESAQQSFVVSDFDRNGTSDILVVAEQNPELRNRLNRQACPSYSPQNYCEFLFRKRVLLFYQGQADGSFKLDFANEGAIKAARETSDSFERITLLSDGAVELVFSGGNAWTWQDSYIFEYKSEGFYEREVKITSCYVAKNRCVTELADMDKRLLISETLFRSRVTKRSQTTLDSDILPESLRSFEMSEL